MYLKIRPRPQLIARDWQHKIFRGEHPLFVGEEMIPSSWDYLMFSLRFCLRPLTGQASTVLPRLFTHIHPW
jgi:hypothetical protein